MWRQTEQSQLLISLAAFEGDILGYCNSSFMLIPNYFQPDKHEVATLTKRESLRRRDNKNAKAPHSRGLVSVLSRAYPQRLMAGEVDQTITVDPLGRQARFATQVR